MNPSTEEELKQFEEHRVNLVNNFNQSIARERLARPSVNEFEFFANWAFFRIARIEVLVAKLFSKPEGELKNEQPTTESQPK